MGDLPVKIRRRYASLGRDPTEAGFMDQRLETGDGDLTHREVMELAYAEQRRRKKLKARRLDLKAKYEERLRNPAPQAEPKTEEKGVPIEEPIPVVEEEVPVAPSPIVPMVVKRRWIGFVPRGRDLKKRKRKEFKGDSS